MRNKKSAFLSRTVQLLVLVIVLCLYVLVVTRGRPMDWLP
jgi:hypothetical protein